MTRQLELVWLQEQTTSLCEEVSQLIERSETEVETPTCAGTTALTIAFVGPYNAGKSTIARALTNLDSIEIGARPTTSSATSFPWRANIRIIDTPGVGTGRADGPAHDESTKQAILEADQLVFVVSDELFDDASANYFKQLLPHRRRTGSLLLVVNKIARTRTEPDQLAADVEQVIAPLSLEEVPMVFIDAASVLRSRESTDPARAAELLERSRWSTFLEALDDMARRSGERSRVIQPLHGAHSALSELIVATSTEDPDSAAYAALLRRRERTIRHCRQQVIDECAPLIQAASQRVAKLGDDLADQLPAGTAFDGQAALKRADQDAERILDDEMAREIMAILERWVRRASGGLEELSHDAVLARIDAKRSLDPSFPSHGRPKGPSGKTVRSMRGTFGDVGRFFTEQSSAGQRGHQVVYRAGKMLNIKFKPWGAVKATRAVGEVGRRLGPVALAVGVLIEIREECKAHQHRREVADARAQVRDAFAVQAETAAEKAREYLDQLVEGSFDQELDRTARLREEQQQQIDATSALAAEATALMARIDEILTAAGT